MNKKSILAVGLICLLVTISGCSTGPNYDHFDLAEGLVDVQTRIGRGKNRRFANTRWPAAKGYSRSNRLCRTRRSFMRCPGGALNRTSTARC